MKIVTGGVFSALTAFGILAGSLPAFADQIIVRTNSCESPMSKVIVPGSQIIVPSSQMIVPVSQVVIPGSSMVVQTDSLMAPSVVTVRRSDSCSEALVPCTQTTTTTTTTRSSEVTPSSSSSSSSILSADLGAFPVYGNRLAAMRDQINNSCDHAWITSTQAGILKAQADSIASQIATRDSLQSVSIERGLNGLNLAIQNAINANKQTATAGNLQ